VKITVQRVSRFMIGGYIALWLMLSAVAVQADFSPGDCAGSDPVSYWKLEEVGILLGVNEDFDDEAPGDNWGACNNNGEHKCPSQSMGQVGFGQIFNEGGVTGIDIGPYEGINWSSTSDFSLELWMKSSPAAGTDVLLGRTSKQADPEGTGMEWFLGVNATSRSATFWLESTASTDSEPDNVQIDGFTDILDDQWHHIVVIRDGANGFLQLWIDGEIEATVEARYSDDFSDGSEPMTIGYLNKGSFFHYNGVIDEIAIYTTVLSEAQIGQHFNDGAIGLRIGYCNGSNPIRIMPLGDSITRGYMGDSTPGSQLVGYRQKLDLDLFDLYRDGDTDYYIDLVGSLVSGTDYPFDWDHEGHGGAYADEIRDNVEDYLSANPADVVLLHIGTNDIGTDQDPLSISLEVNDILNAIYGSYPAMVVILAEIIGRTDSSSWNTRTIELNNYLRDLINGRHNSNPGERLIQVDQYSALNYPGDINSDGLHPNATGYRKMADVWYDALVTFLPPKNEISPPGDVDDGDGGGGGGGGGCFIDTL